MESLTQEQLERDAVSDADYSDKPELYDVFCVWDCDFK